MGGVVYKLESERRRCHFSLSRLIEVNHINIGSNSDNMFETWNGKYDVKDTASMLQQKAYIIIHYLRPSNLFLRTSIFEFKDRPLSFLRPTTWISLGRPLYFLRSPISGFLDHPLSFLNNFNFHSLKSSTLTKNNRLI